MLVRQLQDRTRFMSGGVEYELIDRNEGRAYVIRDKKTKRRAAEPEAGRYVNISPDSPVDEVVSLPLIKIS